MSEITDPAKLLENYRAANAAMSDELIQRTQERDRYRAALRDLKAACALARNSVSMAVWNGLGSRLLCAMRWRARAMNRRQGGRVVKGTGAPGEGTPSRAGSTPAPATHNPQLCARIARVMGGRPGTLTSGKLSGNEWAGTKLTCMVLWDDCTEPVIFQPDTDPTDAWAVLEWVQAKGYEVHIFRSPTVVELWEPHNATEQPDREPLAAEEGESFAGALMNAVAALEGEDD